MKEKLHRLPPKLHFNAVDIPPRPRRLRGAPLNNLNALKHGFYARKFRPTDLVDLAESSFEGLGEEMTMLRVSMRNVIEQCASNLSSANSLSESIEVLCVLSLAAASLPRMAKTQKYLQGNGKYTTLEGLSRLLAQANEKLRTEGVHE